MGEERNGWTNGARHGLRFFARCTQDAWRQSWDAANARLPVLALLLLLGGAWFAGFNPTFPGSTAYGPPMGTALFLAIPWLAVFLVQLVTAPPRVYARLDAELLALTRRSAALSVVSVPALPAPAPTPATLPPLDLPLLDRPPILPPLLGLAPLDLAPSRPTCCCSTGLRSCRRYSTYRRSTWLHPTRLRPACCCSTGLRSCRRYSTYRRSTWLPASPPDLLLLDRIWFFHRCSTCRRSTWPHSTRLRPTCFCSTSL